MKGKIIVIEGTDGCGKKTQSELLFNFLKNNNYNVKLHSFPTYDSISSGPVKMYLNGKMGNSPTSLNPKQSSILFATDRVCTYFSNFNNIKNHYENGGILIFDRYVYSNLIHQACKIDNEDEKSSFINWLINLEFNELNLPQPDLTFFLDMPYNISYEISKNREFLKSGTENDIHENNMDFIIKSYNSAKYISKKMNWICIPCTNPEGLIKSKEEIFNQISNITIEFLSH